jgi:hypothetical protein
MISTVDECETLWKYRQLAAYKSLPLFKRIPSLVPSLLSRVAPRHAIADGTTLLHTSAKR